MRLDTSLSARPKVVASRTMRPEGGVIECLFIDKGCKRKVKGDGWHMPIACAPGMGPKNIAPLVILKVV